MNMVNSPKLRPILYSTPMVSGILQNRKTKTRRIFKDHPRLASDTSKIDLKQWLRDYPENMFAYSQYGRPGDILWVRETWCLTTPYGPEDYYFGYKDGSHSSEEASEKYDYQSPDVWKPSIHMPFEAARIFLRIKSMAIERIQELTEEDAILEGIEKIDDEAFRYDDSVGSFASALSAFRSLWRSINGQNSWEKNPWVWVIEFERITKEQALKEVGHA